MFQPGFWWQLVWQGFRWWPWFAVYLYPRRPMTVPGQKAPRFFLGILAGPLEVRIWDRRWSRV